MTPAATASRRAVRPASTTTGVPKFPLRAAAALFLERQHLRRPRALGLSAKRLVGFLEDAGGLQLDSINVLERAHYLTVWSRFGPYERPALDRMAYRKRVLFEYWAHAACLVPASHFAAWRAVMRGYEIRHTGWNTWLRKNRHVLETVEATIREKGPMANVDFKEARPAGAAGWWNWKPATHALHLLWMLGRIHVHSRTHFQKQFDIADRLAPRTDDPVMEWPEFLRWHLLQSLRGMGAATEASMRAYLSFPRGPAAERRRALTELIERGEVREVAIEGARGRWFVRAEDLEALERSAARRHAAVGSTLLSPFDSFLWHRERTLQLFGFDYRIEVYTPGPKRVHGYYSLPIFHDGHLVGRLDAKNHRGAERLEVRRVHFESWLVKGELPPAARWGRVDRDAVLAGLADSLRSLATFTGATRITVARVDPAGWKRPLSALLG